MSEVVTEPKSRRDTAKDIGRRFIRHENAILIIVLLVLIGVMSAITQGLTTSRANMINVLLQSAIRGMAAVGQAFVILTAGIDISVGGVGLMCSILGATLMTEKVGLSIIGHPIPLPLGILVMLLAGIGWGAINGLSVSRIGMPALIVTLAMWQITKGVGFQLSQGQSVMNLPETLAFFGRGRIVGVPVPVIVFIVVAVVGYFILNYTTFGRSVYAAGGNPVSAWLSGIRVRNVLFSVHVISGFLAGLAGVLMTARIMTASLATLTGLEIDTIVAATVGGISLFGGKGSIIGVVVGALIIGVVNNAMTILGATPDTQGIVKGVIIITAVAVDYIRKR